MAIYPTSSKTDPFTSRVSLRSPVLDRTMQNHKIEQNLQKKMHEMKFWRWSWDNDLLYYIKTRNPKQLFEDTKYEQDMPSTELYMNLPRDTKPCCEKFRLSRIDEKDRWNTL